VADDLAAAVDAEFGEEGETALRVLITYGHEAHEREPDRVRRAILTLSQGDLGRLRHFAERASSDYRDVLMWAEYTPAPKEPNT
jgi:hypothetical protein